MQAFEVEQAQKQQFIEYKYRWVIVCLFGLSIVTNAIASNTISPIANKLTETYGVSKFAVNSIAMIFLFLYTIMNFPANYIIDTRGLRIGVLFTNIQILIGVISLCVGFGI
jgi:fucose permease